MSFPAYLFLLLCFMDAILCWLYFFFKYICFIAIIVVLFFLIYLVPAVGVILWISLKSKCIALNSFGKKRWSLAC